MSDEMIKADHKRWAKLIFDPYINRLLKKNFSNFYMVNESPDIPDDHGLIITPNHISWWDGFFVDYVCKHGIKRKFFIMMLEEQLRKYKFFSKLGAYSIIPENTNSVRETIKYTRNIVKNTSNLAIIYPQGEIEAFEKRPLNLKQGLKLFLKTIDKEVNVLPVGFKIQHYNKKFPAVIGRFGNLLRGEDIINNFKIFEDSFYSNLDALSEAAYNKQFVKDPFTK